MASHRLLSSFALCACLIAISVIGLGAFTRLIDAGLGCPDWPGCYGQAFVPVSATAQQRATLSFPTTPLVTYKAWAEMIHRYMVGGLSFVILIIIGFIFIKKPLRTRLNIILSLCLIALLVYQILLGRWTVTLQLLPVIVTQHLLGGFFILAILWLIYLVNPSPVKKEPNELTFNNYLKNNLIQNTVLNNFNNKSTHALLRKSSHSLLLLAIFGLIILLIQILLGAWTSTHYASLSCPDFPFCNNDQNITWEWHDAFNFFPPIGINYEGGILKEAARQTIQMSHRFGALIFTLYMFFFMVIAYWKTQSLPSFFKVFYFIFGILFIQICIGICNVLFKLPIITAISHTLLAGLLLLSLVTLIYQITLWDEVT